MQPGQEKRHSPHKGVKPSKYNIALLLIIALGLFMCLNFFYGPSPANFADNYVYSNIGYLTSKGVNLFKNSGILTQRYLLISGIALFYLLFGPSRLSAAGFGILCFILSILVIYRIGCELYGRKGGMFSALVYSFSAIDVINATYVGDNGPMAFFVSLSVLLLLLALKDRRRRKYYLIAGFTSMISVLVSSQAIEIMPFMGLMLLIYLAKERSRSMLANIILFAAGIAIAALLIISLSSAFGNPPFYVFTINSSAFWNFCPQSRFGSYLSWLFPDNLVNGIGGIMNILVGRASLSTLNPIISQFFTISNSKLVEGQALGLYGYFAIFGAICLLSRRRFYSLIPALWVAVTFGYMSFGILSISKPLFICTAVPRLMLIFTPALSLLIGMGLASLTEAPKSRAFRYAAYIIALAVILALFYSSYVIINYSAISQYKYIYPVLQIADFIKGLPANASIYAAAIPIDISYTGAGHNVYGLGPGVAGCGSIPNGSYFVMPRNYTLQSLCNLTIAFTPKPPLPYMYNYTLFDNYSFGTYYGYVVYHRS
jgi:4-amino-4-deoxy-L-arabinose transferase-like glycosyltransferase